MMVIIKWYKTQSKPNNYTINYPCSMALKQCANKTQLDSNRLACSFKEKGSFSIT